MEIQICILLGGFINLFLDIKYGPQKLALPHRTTFVQVAYCSYGFTDKNMLGELGFRLFLAIKLRTHRSGITLPLLHLH